MTAKQATDSQMPQGDSPCRPEEVYRLLGLAKRAGRLLCGTEAVFKALRQRQARLVIVAADAAERTGRNLQQQAADGRVPVAVFGEMEKIGQWTGSTQHALVAVLDTHFAGRLLTLIHACPAG